MEVKNKIKYYSVFKENPSNPARVDLDTGVIEVNLLAFYLLTDFERKFVILHEQGHYEKQTLNEVEADLYALERLAFTEKESLKQFVNAVKKISRNDNYRIEAAKINALKFAAKDGSKEAKQQLKKVVYKDYIDIYEQIKLINNG